MNESVRRIGWRERVAWVIALVVRPGRSPPGWTSGHDPWSWPASSRRGSPSRGGHSPAADRRPDRMGGALAEDRRTARARPAVHADGASVARRGPHRRRKTGAPRSGPRDRRPSDGRPWIDRGTEPDRADGLLGPDLVEYVAGPPHPRQLGPRHRRHPHPNRGTMTDSSARERTVTSSVPPDLPLPLGEVGARAVAVLDEVDRAVVGKRAALELVLAAVLAGGHVLLEDFPGLGKTLAARSFAQTLGLEFTRAQFTPDMLPGDLTVSFIYDQRAGEFTFRRVLCSPACCWPTRSIGRRRRRSPRSSRPCRSSRSRSRARRSDSHGRSSCSQRGTGSLEYKLARPAAVARSLTGAGLRSARAGTGAAHRGPSTSHQTGRAPDTRRFTRPTRPRSQIVRR